MFSSSAFKVSFLTIYTTSPFEIIFGERRDTETQFSNSLAYNCSTSFYFIFRKPYRCPKSTHRLIHLFPTDLKCKYYHKLNLHLYLYLFFFFLLNFVPLIFLSIPVSDIVLSNLYSLSH